MAKVVHIASERLAAISSELAIASLAYLTVIVLRERAFVQSQHCRDSPCTLQAKSLPD